MASNNHASLFRTATGQSRRAPMQAVCSSWPALLWLNPLSLSAALSSLNVNCVCDEKCLRAIAALAGMSYLSLPSECEIFSKLLYAARSSAVQP